MSTQKPMPTRKRKSTTRRELVANRILDEAASLFAERGFSETSLQEVAEALEISRTALYHYIGSKDELLATLVRGMAQTSAEELESIARDRSLDPLEKLRRAAVTMTTRIGNSPARFRMLLLSEGALVEPIASEHGKARRRILEAIASIVEQGAASGALRPIDPNVAAFALLGMCNWVAWWYDPDRAEGQSPESIAETIAGIAINGLQASGGDAAKNGASPAQRALARIREDLTLLEHALANGEGKPQAKRGSRTAPARRARR